MAKFIFHEIAPCSREYFKIVSRDIATLPTFWFSKASEDSTLQACLGLRGSVCRQNDKAWQDSGLGQ